jgi:tRNA threonylcarbamoyladenosine biosynthesis protein TsaB
LSEPASVTVLGLDSAGAACSAALWRNGAPGPRRFEVMARGQSERLVPMIEEVMAEAGLDYPALDAFAVTRGPGAFTGVRIGLAAARGLALACGRPVVGLSSFEAVAAALPDAAFRDRTVAVVIDSKRAEAFCQAFESDRTPAGPRRAFALEALDRFLPPGPVLLAGTGAAQAAPVLAAAGRAVEVAEDATHADAAVVARVAAGRPLPSPGAPMPGPIYLRGADVTMPDGARVQAAVPADGA